MFIDDTMTEEQKQLVPFFPQKKTQYGSKKTVEELMKDLEDWLNKLIRIKEIARMLYVR